jgi:hypothetical protein
MLDSWASGMVFKHAFTGIAFSHATAPLTDNHLSVSFSSHKNKALIISFIIKSVN